MSIPDLSAADPRLALVEEEFAKVHRALRRLAVLRGVPPSSGVLRMAHGLMQAGALPVQVYDAIDHLRAAHDIMVGMEQCPGDVLSRYVASARRTRRVLKQLMNVPVG